MKLELDKKYLKISVYVILTIVFSYAMIKIIDSAAYTIVNLREIFSGINYGIGKLFSVFTVLIMALIISYLVDPLVDFFQIKYEKFIDRINKNKKLKSPKIDGTIQNVNHSKKFKLLNVISTNKKVKKSNTKTCKVRTEGTIIVYLLFFVVIAIILSFIVTTVMNSTNSYNNSLSFGQKLSNVIYKNINDISETYNEFAVYLRGIGITQSITDILGTSVENLKKFGTEISKNIVNTISSIGGGVVNFSLSLVVAFYFLRDKEKMQTLFNDFAVTYVNKKLLALIKHFLEDVNAVFSGYIRGQLTDAAIMSVLISVILSIIGVDFAVFIGVFSGIANLIPYFGAFVGFILSIAVSLLKGDVTQAITAAIAIIILQQIDGMFIVPKVVGEKVELSPIMVLLSLSVFGSLFGLVGMVFAVPIVAILKIFLLRFTERKKKFNLEKERELKFKSKTES